MNRLGNHHHHHLLSVLSVPTAIASCAVLLFSIAGSALAAATTSTTNMEEPFNGYFFIPCGNGGSGDVIYLGGSLHILFHTTDTGNGQFLFRALFNPQGVSGYSLSTGIKYQAVGMTQFTSTFNAGIHSTFVNQFYLVGQGPNDNFKVHEDFHFTVNADGTVTVIHDNFRIECI